MSQAPPARRQQYPQSPYQAARIRAAQKKARGISVALTVASITGAVLLLAGIGLAGWRFTQRWTAQNAYVPAVEDALSLVQLRELADSAPEGSADLKVPESIDESVILLSSRDRDDKRVFGLQQRIATEYLYGSEVGPSKRNQVSQALATTFALSFLDKRDRVILLKTFRRWGTSDHLPQLFAAQMGDSRHGMTKGRKGYGSDAILEHLLHAAREHQSLDIAPWLAGLLSSSVGGQAESLLKSIGPQAAPYLILVHDSDDTEAVARTTRLLKDYDVDVMELRIEHYVTQAKDDSSWDRREAYRRLAAIPFEPTYQDRIVDFLVTQPTSDRHALDRWLEAVLVWGDERCLTPVSSVLRSGYYWDSHASLPFIKKFGNSESIGTLVALLLSDSYHRDRPAVAEALISLCRTNTDVDLRTSVHEPIVRQLHDMYRYRVDDVWRVLRATDVDPTLIVEQTLNDLTSPDSGRERSAWETMSTVQIDDSMREEAVKRLAELLSGESHVSRQQRTCFLRWAPSGHPLSLKWLSSGYLADDDFATVMGSVINANASPELVIVVANSLADRRRHEPTMQILLAKCDDPAPIASAMLQSTNPTVLQAACRVLAAKGDSEHLQSLSELHRKALKARNAMVVAATREAARLIRTRENEMST